MEIKALKLGIIGENCYLLSTDKAAVVIDPGFPRQEITDFLNNNSQKERLILLTHAHFDHIGMAEELRRNTDTKIAIGVGDSASLLDLDANLARKFRIRFEPFSADITFKDGDEFSVGDIDFKVFETPGHTKGSVCYFTEDKLFSGDTLFFENIGRTDFEGGSFEEIEKSIKRLYTLGDNIEVYPGHGDKTTISHEKINNPYVRG